MLPVNRWCTGTCSTGYRTEIFPESFLLVTFISEGELQYTVYCMNFYVTHRDKSILLCFILYVQYEFNTIKCNNSTNTITSTSILFRALTIVPITITITYYILSHGQPLNTSLDPSGFREVTSWRSTTNVVISIWIVIEVSDSFNVMYSSTTVCENTDHVLAQMNFR